MLFRFAVAVQCLLLAACQLAAQTATKEKQRPSIPRKINERFLDPKLDAQQWVKRFEAEKREVYAYRKKIVEALKLSAGERVADVGSGTGLFLKQFSEVVTEKGRVYAIDISPKLIEYLDKRVEEEKLANVRVMLSKGKSTTLPAASVDVVFVCDTYHHFEHYREMLRSIHGALREGGRLVVIDFERIPGKSPKWILGHVRAGKEQFKKEIEQAGFHFEEEVKMPGFRQNYFLRFQKCSR